MNESNTLNKNLLFLEICAAKKCITEKNIYAYRTYHYSDITDPSHPISPFIPYQTNSAYRMCSKEELNKKSYLHC